MTHIKKGLDLPLSGAPTQKIEEATPVKRVAVVGPDYVGMKPSMKVQVGDAVKVGQALFECKKNPGLVFTAPAAGKVVEVNRGERRVFESLVIEVEGDEQVEFSNFKGKGSNVSFEEAKDLLIESGLWTSLRRRPFSTVARVNERPHSVFVTAMDTNPHAVNPEVVLSEYSDDFKVGLEVISKLTEGKTYLCKATGAKVPTAGNVEVKEFSGKHPAGNVGTHVHFVDPVNENKFVWHVGYQDVISIGKLFTTGKLWLEKVIAVSGPQAKNPRLLRTRQGACLETLLKDEVLGGETRVVSGSVLNGRKAVKTFSYLGRYHNQVSLLEEDREREFFGWHSPGFDKFSVKRTFLSFFTPSKKFNLTTKLHGSERAMVPVGMFESVMPMDILPTQLLRALVTNDTDYAVTLGCLELDEEDLALCTFASPGKVDFGPALRNNLTIIEKEG
ncbi:Na(+)-translocating NADH-quinone reductase subunit A [Halobacteriovorax sp. GB3]|uniref:Na(+)-translocating NADH-quinone reductase subunit A n=1 Tax=Halobacteriovorax sp. GB3 TaxID=2719615 RepID=UPI00235E80B8|nr:Na(+)-translocating NADH-quinone reductase subunit A [Halobacteriovorax sp. GB3]MDD0853545.1 Na(+)-translocating NADH-quinone reductase subunit A [Halobacteriovorax sp. GB3]